MIAVSDVTKVFPDLLASAAASIVSLHNGFFPSVRPFPSASTQLKLSLPAFLDCCSTVRHCLSKVDIVELYEMRSSFLRLSGEDRNNWMYKALGIAYEAASQDFRLKLAGWPVCRDCYATLLGITVQTLNTRIR